MSNSQTTPFSYISLSEKFANQLKNSKSIGKWGTIYYHANFTFSQESFELIKKQYSNSINYTIACAFDYLNEYTNINFEKPETFKNLNFGKLSMNIDEYADSKCDTYINDAYNTASIFGAYCQEALEGLDHLILKKYSNPLYDMIVIGEYEFYSQFARFILAELEKFVEENDLNDL